MTGQLAAIAARISCSRRPFSSLPSASRRSDAPRVGGREATTSLSPSARRTSTPTCWARSAASTSRSSAILKNPNTDPHTFEASPSVAEEVAKAQLIVQNGVGYDSFMNNIEAASPNSAAQGHRRPRRARPSHRYAQSAPLVQPTTMPAVARVMVKDLDQLAAASRGVLPGEPHDL